MITIRYFGPYGLDLILDPSKIHLDDPGRDTPVLACLADKCAGYTCAVNEGEIDGIRLSRAQIVWLEKMEDRVEEFLRGGTKPLMN